MGKRQQPCSALPFSSHPRSSLKRRVQPANRNLIATSRACQTLLARMNCPLMAKHVLHSLMVSRHTQFHLLSRMVASTAQHAWQSLAIMMGKRWSLLEAVHLTLRTGCCRLCKPSSKLFYTVASLPSPCGSLCLCLLLLSSCMDAVCYSVLMRFEHHTGYDTLLCINQSMATLHKTM